jgi:hypothetical protein
MGANADIIALRNAYEQLQSQEVRFEYGPLRAYDNPESVQRLWRSTIDPAVALVHQNSKKEAEGRYVATAPSPWHAYFYFRAQQHHVYRAGRPLSESGNKAQESGGEHMFFRGQRCANWSFESSMRRKDTPGRTIEQRATTALAEYFRSKFVANGDIATNTALCFAQHYGIATDLADVSCDPDMAVWFATHPAGKGCPSGEADAVVRAVTWASQQRGAKIRTLLPPPFVRNVYTQRGLFVDTSTSDGLLKGHLTLDVRFPRETIGGEFRVIRAGSPLEVWPVTDECEQELVQWARNVAASCADDNGVHELVKSHEKQGSLPRFWLERELYDFDKHVLTWMSILDWVLPATCVTALPVSDAVSPMRYEILDLKVGALVRANSSLFDAFIKASEGCDFTGHGVLRQVLLVASKELSGELPKIT